MTTPQALEIDLASAGRRPLTPLWTQSFGAGRANEALRADWQAQLRELRASVPFRYIRFHGLFHDDMFVHRSSYGGGFGPDDQLETAVHTFSYVDKVFDALLDAGVTPFVELGFMPTGLATKHRTLFWWGAHCSPPTDYEAWGALVRDTVQHWIERYGLDEVLSWRFEVWNEPNLGPFWAGTRTEYFRLYETSVREIKAIDERLKVGGPATSVFVPDERYAGDVEERAPQHATALAEDVDALDWRPVWIEEFLDFCAERQLPCDFVSTHLYPTDYAFGQNGQARAITRHRDATKQDLEHLQGILDRRGLADCELHITEWSTSPSSRDWIHDTTFAATYITRAYLECAELADSLSYWTFSDIFEEGGGGLGPFHGGFGVISEHGIRKPTFHAFEMLSRLGLELVHKDDRGAITVDDRGRPSAVLYNYPVGEGSTALAGSDSLDTALRNWERGSTERVTLRLLGLSPDSEFTLEVLDRDHGNPLEEWDRMGRPLNLTPQQETRLREVGTTLRTQVVRADSGGVLHVELELAPWAVASLYPTD